MIDWYYLSMSGLWVLGFSMILAIIGIARYQGKISGFGLKTVVKRPIYRLVLDLSVFLVCAGLAGSPGLPFTKISFGLLAIILFGRLIQNTLKIRRTNQS